MRVAALAEAAGGAYGDLYGLPLWHLKSLYGAHAELSKQRERRTPP